MAGNIATLTFAGDAKALIRASAQASGAIDTVSKASDVGSRALGTLQGTIDRVGGVVGDASTALQSLSDIQNMDSARSMAHARALQEVQQAQLDLGESAQEAEQASQDLAQSQRDVNRAMLDGRQAERDLAGAHLDITEAALDVEEAQKKLTDAIRENGAGSMEARRASLELDRAREGQQQAILEVAKAEEAGRQALQDRSQAETNGRQALLDGAQAAKSAKDAQLDLTEARKAASPSDMSKAISDLQAYSGAAMGAMATVSLLQTAYAALNVEAVASTASMVAQKVAMVAGTVATGVATAAQWLLNVALAANPIGLVVLAIAALVAGIVWVATQTTWFQTAWTAAWGFIKDVAGAAWAGIKWYIDTFMSFWGSVPGRIGSIFSSVGNFIFAPFRWAFNMISDAWNRTVGSLRWTVPSWVPMIGGNSVGAPKLPKFHSGGVVPGVMGQEVLAVLQAGETVVPASGGGSQPVQVVLRGDGSRLSALLLEVLRDAIGGRDVQAVLGGRG